eukprot:jgi/Mesen1/9859/ME000070S09146
MIRYIAGCLYRGTFTPLPQSKGQAYQLALSVSVGGELIGGGPTAFKVVPRASVPTGATTWALAPSGLEVRERYLGNPVQSGPTSFTLQLRDAQNIPTPLGSPANVTVVVTPFRATGLAGVALGNVTAGSGGAADKGNSVQIALPTRGGGDLTATVTVGQAGNYTVVYSVNGSPPSKAFQLSIPPGPAVSADIVLPPASLAVAGGIMAVVVRTYDSRGVLRVPGGTVGGELGPVRLQLAGPASSMVAASTIPLLVGGGGEYEGRFRPLAAGAYNLTVLLNGTAARSAALFIRHGAFAGSAGGVREAPLAAQAGNATRVAFDARDQFGNAFTSSGLNFSVTLSANGTAFYQAKTVSGGGLPLEAVIAPTLAGRFNVSVVETTTGTELPGSPFPLTVLPGQLSASGSRLAGLQDGRAGSLQKFSLYARDVFLNNVADVLLGSNFTAAAVGGAGNQTSVAVTLAPPAGGNSGAPGPVTLAFQPLVPGTYYVSVRVNGTDVAGSPAAMSTRAAPDPVIVGATFDETQRQILVDFDVPTDRAGQVANSTNCTAVLAAPSVGILGRDAICRWRSRRQLAVLLGSGSPLLPFTAAISAQASATSLTLRANSVLTDGRNSAYTGGSIAVGPPRGAARGISAALSGPATVGICDTLVLDASATGGTYGQALTYTFRAISTYELVQLDIRFLEHDGGPLFTVPPGLLTPGSSYRFLVSAENALGERGDASLSVAQSPAAVPLVAILAPGRRGGRRVIAAHKGQATRLEASVTLPTARCSLNNFTVGLEVRLEWQLLLGPALNFSAVRQLAQSQRSRVLSIPPHVLAVGQTYVFALKATLAANPKLSAVDSVSVLVSASNLTVRIEGGDGRQVSAGDETVLQAVADDPDHLASLSGADLAFTYAWSCRPANESAPPECPMAATSALNQSANNATLAIPPFALPEGTYIITVAVSKEPLSLAGKELPGRSRQLASVTLEVSDALIPGVSVSRAGPIASAAGEELAPPGDVELNCSMPGVPYEYKWFFRDHESAELDVDLQVSNVPLVVPGGFLTVSRPYTYVCKLFRDPPGGAPVASASYTLQGVEGPWGGRLLVTRVTADATGTRQLYSLAAPDWTAVDSELPLRYLFSYRLENGTGSSSSSASSDYISLSPMVWSHRAVVLLPAGSLSVAVTVMGASGASVLVSIPLQVKAGNLTAGKLLANVLPTAVGTGDVAMTLQLMDVWGRQYGGYVPGGGVSRADTAPASKQRDELVAAFLRLNQGVVPTSSYVEQASCALSRLSSVPGELSAASASGMLRFLVAAVQLAAQGGNASVSLGPRAAECCMMLVSDLLVVANQSAPAVRAEANGALFTLPGQVALAVLTPAVRGRGGLNITTPNVVLIGEKECLRLSASLVHLRTSLPPSTHLPPAAPLPAQCCMMLVSDLLVVANQSAPAVRAEANGALFTLPGQVALAVLTPAVRGRGGLNITTPNVVLIGEKVSKGTDDTRSQSAPDFLASAGSASCALNVTDVNVPPGGGVAAFMYTFTGVSPLPSDSRVDGQVAVVQAAYDGVNVDFELGIEFVVGPSNGSVSVRKWNGTAWIFGPLTQRPSPAFANGSTTSVAAAEAARTSYAAFAPYLERVALPPLLLPPIPAPPPDGGFHPSFAAMLLALLLPPALLFFAMVTILGCVGKRRAAGSSSTTDDSEYEEDKDP